MSEVKQVIVMRKDLKMRRGKEISQGCHASLKIFFDRMQRLYWGEKNSPDADDEYDWISELTPEMESWKEGHFTKICVYVDSEEELLNIVQQAKDADLPVALICDKGLTEFDGVPTHTCCAIGPDNSDKINELTGDLRLY